MTDNQITSTIIDIVNKKIGALNIPDDISLPLSIANGGTGTTTAAAALAALGGVKAETGNYTGSDSVASRDISLSFTPKLAIVVSRSTSAAYLLGVTMNASSGVVVDTTPAVSISTAFKLGTNKFVVGGSSKVFNTAYVFDYVAVTW